MKTFQELQEGLYDPNIFKAFFLAGGPGSGKTWIARGLFGIPDRVNVSQSGLKMVNTDKELKYLLNKYGFGTNLDILPDEVFKNLTDPTQKDYSGLRSFAKELTGVRKEQYMNGRLGMIIDGTGDDFKEIRKQKKEVEKKGYDTFMIFVNTSLDIALQRNEKRDRVLPTGIVKQSHREVTKNIGGYQGLFGGGNFLVIDNNKDLDEETYFATYAYGPLSIGYQVADIDNGTTNFDTDVYGVSFNVNDALSVSYQYGETSGYGGGNDQAEFEGISAAYNIGPMAISFTDNTGKNMNGTTNDDDNRELNLSMSF